MLLKNLELKKSDECLRDEYAICIGETRIGFVVNAAELIKGIWEIDGVIIGKHKTEDLDFILPIEVTDAGLALLKQRTNTATFTKRVCKLLGFKSSNYNCRFYRGFYKDHDGLVYDAANKLLYNHKIHPTAGVMLDYPTKTSKKAISLISTFGNIEPPVRRSRRFPR